MLPLLIPRAQIVHVLHARRLGCRDLSEKLYIPTQVSR